LRVIIFISKALGYVQQPINITFSGWCSKATMPAGAIPSFTTTIGAIKDSHFNAPLFLVGL
jgi:hypothetical protein